MGMKHYPCCSCLIISCCEINNGLTKVAVSLEHHIKHVNYINVSMPLGALDFVCKNLEWLTPVAMVAKVQAAYPDITAAQIHMAWMQMSQCYDFERVILLFDSRDQKSFTVSSRVERP